MNEREREREREGQRGKSKEEEKGRKWERKKTGNSIYEHRFNQPEQALIRFNKPIRYKNPPFTRFTWGTGTSSLFLFPSPRCVTSNTDSRTVIEAKISVKIIDGEKWLMNFASSSICIQLVSISCFNFVIRTNVLTENNRLLSIDAKVSVRTVVSEEWWRKLVIFRASLSNFFPVHIKVVLKPVWTYGIQLWGTASNSNRNSSTIPIKNSKILNRWTWVCYQQNNIIATLRHLQLKKKYPNSVIDIT